MTLKPVFSADKLHGAAELRNSHALKGSRDHHEMPPWSDLSQGFIVSAEGYSSTPDELFLTLLRMILRKGLKLTSVSVVALAFVISGSPGAFGDPLAEKVEDRLRPEKIREFSGLVLEWLRNKWGDRLVAVEEHADEQNYHIHALVVPITEDGRLCAAEIMTPEFLKACHTEIAEVLACMGFQRAREGGGRRATPPTAYYKAMNAPMPVVSLVPTPPLGDRSELEHWVREQNRSRRPVALALEYAAQRAKKMERVQRNPICMDARPTALPNDLREYTRDEFEKRLALIERWHLVRRQLRGQLSTEQHSFNYVCYSFDQEFQTELRPDQIVSIVRALLELMQPEEEDHPYPFRSRLSDIIEELKREKDQDPRDIPWDPAEEEMRDAAFATEPKGRSKTRRIDDEAENDYDAGLPGLGR
ncbi:plasmid recombination protein [Parvibaculum sp.]|uniref:plasmid recombination protein n=1 Tax=Parvibaculum sp. TaxID=2024848 RepID=UPI000C91D659|nr:plasmid recombination protein [Parvibaculum sp.]MAB15108.1 hypothetical protein [Parvibaculum sp.]